MSKDKGCKIVLFRDGGVGKACIISRYISGQYDGTSAATNVASYCIKSINFSQLNKTLLLDEWDASRSRKISCFDKIFL